MILVNRKVEGLAIDLPGARVDDLDMRIEVPACLEQGQLRCTIDLEIAMRSGHRIKMAGASGKIEYVVDSTDRMIDYRVIADVRDNYLDPVANTIDVVEVPALPGIERI